MLFLFRSAPEVEKRIHSKLFRKFWRSRGTKEPAYITVYGAVCLFFGVVVLEWSNSKFVWSFNTWVFWQLSQVTLQHHSNLNQQNLRKALWNLNVTSLIINQIKIVFHFLNVVYLQLQDVMTWTSFLKKKKKVWNILQLRLVWNLPNNWD